MDLNKNGIITVHSRIWLVQIHSHTINNLYKQQKREWNTMSLRLLSLNALLTSNNWNMKWICSSNVCTYYMIEIDLFVVFVSLCIKCGADALIAIEIDAWIQALQWFCIFSHFVRCWLFNLNRRLRGAKKTVAFPKMIITQETHLLALSFDRLKILSSPYV